MSHRLTTSPAQTREVSDQAKEILHLKAQIKKLKKQATPVIKHHRAWLQSVSLKQRLARKRSSKKQRVHKESVSKQCDKRSDEDFISIGSAEDEILIKRMNEKGIDSSKDQMVKEESKEVIKEESK
ncbi:hypothetical protein Tco_1438182 [Tanacetum coccineum]